MLFPTIDFAIFFCVTFAGHWLLRPGSVKWKLSMIAASYVFYGWADPALVWLLAAVTVTAQFGTLNVARARGERSRRVLLSIAVAATIAPLLWFKYYAFAALNLANAFESAGLSSPLPLLQIVLPIGISFFTFMALSYVIDVYRGRVAPVSWVDFFLYLSFFPHLVAGPIVRTEQLVPQLREARNPRRVDMSRGAWLVLTGLFKKMVISSFLATAIVDPVFADPARHSAIEVLLAIYGYAVVIYADFSGYTDIAIGVAALLGYRFPQNFHRPYSARSLQDFWRRWHMTLSRWLRDYLYIPLGGSRRGERRTYVNIVLTMVLGGLWHGAAWTFVAWGAYHGAGQALGYRRRTLRARRGLTPQTETAAARTWQRFVTFNLVCLGWVFFRAESIANALAMLGRLVAGWSTETTLVTPLILVAIAAVLLGQFVPRFPAQRLQAGFSRLAPTFQGAALGGTLFLISTLGPQGVAPFIYYRF